MLGIMIIAAKKIVTSTTLAPRGASDDVRAKNVFKLSKTPRLEVTNSLRLLVRMMVLITQLIT